MTRFLGQKEGLSMEYFPEMLRKLSEAVWEYDPDRNQVYIYHDNMTPGLCGKWSDYGEIFALYRDQYVHHLDRHIWEKQLAPAFLEELCREKKSCNIHIHMEDSTGRFEWHEVFMEPTEAGTLLLSSRDIQNNRRNEAIVAAIQPEFDYVCYIDIESGIYSLYPSEYTKSIVPQNLSENYPRVMREFNRVVIVPEQCEEATAKMELPYVLRELEYKDEHVVYLTVMENGGRFHKKLRYCYEDESRKRLLLSRVDISDVVREQELRREEEKKRLEYLDDLPIACCMTKVILDENQEPCDFEYTYQNRAHARLEEVEYGELVGKRFYEFFQETDRSWLKENYDTAYRGIPHVVNRYSPEIGKHLLIHTFQPEYGYCGCVVQDVTEQHFLEEELKRNRRKVRYILQSTTELVFQYDLEDDMFLPLKEGDDEFYSSMPLTEMITRMREEDLISQEDQNQILSALDSIRNGAHEGFVDFCARRRADDPFNWYKLTLFDYMEGGSHRRCVLGYVQDIEQIKMQHEKLRQEAQVDALTGVLNARAGVAKIRQKLEQHDGSYYSAMFLLDLDDFKRINDTRGHMAGDETLKEFAQILYRTFRTEDVIYRLGGDEFVVFVENVKNPNENIGAMMERLFKKLGQAEARKLPMTSSVGVYVTKEKCAFEEYYARADQALYQTKKRGKNDYTVVVDG